MAFSNLSATYLTMQLYLALILAMSEVGILSSICVVVSMNGLDLLIRIVDYRVGEIYSGVVVT
jgi:hypothetical protein